MVGEKQKTSNWLHRLFEPRFDFYRLLNQHARTVLACMTALDEWIVAGAKDRCQRVRDLENAADDLKLEIEKKLSDAFVTPFDREDIYDLALLLDEVANSAKACAREMEAMEIKVGPGALKEMVATLLEGTRCICHSIEHLNGDLQEAANMATLARKSENRFSRTYRGAMRELFTHDDWKFVMKSREIFKTMVDCAERIDKVGEKLLHIIVKSS